MANREQIIDWLTKEVKIRTEKALNNVVDYATNQAQNGFDRFTFEVPSDDPFVFVYSSPMAQTKKYEYSRTIKCVGNQVLFIEFGAGKYYYTGDTEARLYQSVLPINLRPSGIYDIGNYGKGRGKDDVWFYKSQTGRESENASLFRQNRNGEAIMITHGNRPARALYRAVGMAIRRLKGGKFK